MVASSARKYRPARSASAKLMPSAEMPKPENIGRIVTGPKSENRSIRKSRSMAPLMLRASSRPCAGTHNTEASRYRIMIDDFAQNQAPVVMGQAKGRDDAEFGSALAVHFRSRELHRLAATAGAGL